MVDRRGSRFALEVVFLVALAVGVTLAEARPLVIAAVMLVGWLIVAAVEWAAWRDAPHYGSGLPPRYFVPRVSLPPPQPLEQVRVGYPESHREEAPTWIASAALRAEMLGEWPIAAPGTVEDEDDVDDDALAVPLPPPEPEPEGAPVALPEPESEPEPPSEPEPEPEPEPLAVAEPVAVVALSEARAGVARYTLDPLGEPPAKRRFGRRQDEDLAAVEVPARPPGPRALPGRSAPR